MGNTMSDGSVFEDTEENHWRHGLADEKLCTGEAGSRGAQDDGAVYLQGYVHGGVLAESRGWKDSDCFFWRALLRQDARGIVFMAHGYNASSFEIGRRAQFFRSLGMNVLAMDLMGHGRSPGKRVRIWKWDADLVEPFVQFVRLSLQQPDAVLGSRDAVPRLWAPQLPVFLYGTSMGGAVAFLTGQQLGRPLITGGVLLAAPLFRVPTAPSNLVRSLLAPVKYVLPFIKVAGGPPPENPVDAGFSSDPKKAAWLEETAYYRSSPGTPLPTAAALLNMADHCRTLFSSYEVPFLVMHGDKDRVTCPECSVRLFEENTALREHERKLVLYKDALHVLSFERDEIVEMHEKDMAAFVEDRVESFASVEAGES